MTAQMQADYTKCIVEANNLLEKYHIADPIVNVFDIAKNEGVRLEFRDMPEKLRDVAGFYDPKTKTIFVNDDDPPNRQMFTIAHELGHYILSHQPYHYDVLPRWQKTHGDSRAEEKEANCFAAHLLVPDFMLDKLKKEYKLNFKDEIDREILSKMFGVSRQMMDMRIRFYEKAIA